MGTTYEGMERRGNNTMEMQQSLLKLIGKVETMENNVETKLEAIKDKIQNLDERLGNRISVIEKQMDTHCEDDILANDLLSEHDKKILKAESYVDRIHSLEAKYIVLNDKVTELAEAPTRGKAKIITDFSAILRNVFYTAISAGAIGLLIWLVTNYIKR